MLFIAGRTAVNLAPRDVEVVDTEVHSRQVCRNAANNMKALRTPFVNALSFVIKIADIKTIGGRYETC